MYIENRFGSLKNELIKIQNFELMNTKHVCSFTAGVKFRSLISASMKTKVNNLILKQTTINSKNAMSQCMVVWVRQWEIERVRQH